MVIRPEQPADADAIRAVLVSAFPTDAEARLVEALRSAERLTVSLVAEEQGRIVGHAALSPVLVSQPSGEIGADATASNEAMAVSAVTTVGKVPVSGARLGLAPVAVAPDRQRQGVGGRLVLAALASATRMGVDFVVVLGDPAYYSRFGFEAAAGWELTSEFGGGPAFQAIELRAGAIPRGAGLVRYAPEFAVVAGS